MSGPPRKTARTPPAKLGEARKQFRPADKLRWLVELEIVPRGQADTAHAAAQSTRHSAYTRGIGIGGAFIETDVSAQVGDDVRLWLFPPSSLGVDAPEVLRAHGEVRWLREGGPGDRPGGMGVAFRALTAADEVHLHRCFSASLKKKVL